LHAAYVVENLTKIYGAGLPPANDAIDLTIYEREVFGLLGPNGAGKSTLVRQLCGLARPTHGQIRLFDRDLVREPHLARQWVALQPQNMALPLQTRVAELLELTGRLRGLSPAEARRQTEALLAEFGLEPLARKTLYVLSGGQRRLVGIATTLIGDRPVLVFDEPTNELDPQIRRKVWGRIRQAARAGATVVLVTHNVVEAEEALDRVAILSGGRVLALGTVGEIKERVARQVRLDLVFRPDRDGVARELLAGWPAVHQTGARRYHVVVPQAEAERAIHRILPYLACLDDFRIITPNLEDVYLEVSGGKSL
jgi:ABC-2 type transport system ATP-binding protein